MKHILFEAEANRSRQQTFQCAGYPDPVTGTVYPRSSLRWHGVPLGGLGTGYVTWNTDGRFGQCTVFNQVPFPDDVPDLKSIPFQLTADGQTFALAMRGGDGKGDLRDLNYFGHYPVADVRFSVGAPVEVEIRAYGPFIPGDAAASNTPAIIFEAYIRNTGDRAISAELSFTPPAAPKPAEGFSEAALKSGAGSENWASCVMTHPWHQAKPSMGNRPSMNETGIAVKGGHISHDNGALKATFAAAPGPGETVKTTFIFAWYQPYLRDPMSRAEKLKYADRFPGAAEVLEYAAEAHQSWFDRIVRWQIAIYRRADMPGPIREALVNSFYTICKNSHWISKWRPDDWFPEEGLLLVNESYTTCPLSETLPCHYLGSFVSLFFFPELEKTTLEAYRHYQLSTGELPFALSNGFGARTPYYQAQHTNGAGEYIELLLRYWLRTGDDATLAEHLPSAKAAARYLDFLDSDDDGLVNEQSHALPGEDFPANVPWDRWPQKGTSGYTAMKCITSLLALARMAAKSGDAETERECLEKVARGRARLNELLWNGRYYDLAADQDGARDDSCLLAQVTGSWAASILGIESPVPPENILSCISSISELCDNKSQYGYVLAVHGDGSPVYSNFTVGCDFPRDVWPLYNFIFTAVCLYAGVPAARAWDSSLKVTDALFRAANAMPWGWPCNLSGTDGWIGHGHDYQDPLAIWTIPLAADKQDIRTGTGAGSLVADIISSAKG